MKELFKLEKDAKKRIVDKMEWFAMQDDPLSFAKTIKGKLYGSHRFRIGDYRVLVEVHNDIVHVLLVLAVRHRKDAYRI